jgi:PLP dependent protein
MTAETVRDNVLRVRERIAAAAGRARRRIEDITLLGVSKTHSAEAIREAFAAGVRHFGENRVQEWEGKLAGTRDLAGYWHLIGHLQSNKAARAAKVFDAVDSVHDFALAQRLDRARAEAGDGKLRVLIEVRVADEDSKSGVEKEQLPGLAEKILMLEQLDLAGLMCIPPYLDNAEKVRPYFAELREMKQRLEGRLGRALPVVSMGMSHDFEVAIEEGATEVRIGTALFGARETP